MCPQAVTEEQQHAAQRAARAHGIVWKCVGSLLSLLVQRSCFSLFAEGS